MNDKENRKVLIGIVVGLILILICFGDSIFGGSSSSGGSGDSRTCGSCDRTFTDSGNTMSIARTGMCKNCYNNFQAIQGALENNSAKIKKNGSAYFPVIEYETGNGEIHIIDTECSCNCA